MKWMSFSLIAAFALFTGACEQHPLPGDPPPGEEEHEKVEAHEAKAGEEHKAAPAEHAKPAEEPGKASEAHAGEAPKFFPKPEEKK